MHQLQELQPIARQRNAATRHDPVVRAAAEEFNAIILHAEARGVSSRSMAADLGVTLAALRNRIRRHTGNPVPSQRPKVHPQGSLQNHGETVRALARFWREATFGKPGDPSYAERARQQADETLLFLVDVVGAPLGPVATSLALPFSTVASAAQTARDRGVQPRSPTLTACPTENDAHALTPPADPVAHGTLKRFSADVAPNAPAAVGQKFVVDPALRDARTALHHQAVRRLSCAAEAAGFTVEVWDVGQDAAFLANGVLVNIEVKTLPDDSTVTHQLRLGLGQLEEQVEHHRLSFLNAVPWYKVAELRGIVKVLVVESKSPIPRVWSSVAERLGVLLTPVEGMIDSISNLDLRVLPVPVPLER